MVPGVTEVPGRIRVGLTGGIGSGKSTVAAMLVEHGATLVDTDAIAHAITAPGGEAIPRLTERFGAGVIDASGALDRARMRERVFADPLARRQLEAILHPMIGEIATRQSEQARTRVVVFDVPLLTDSSPWRARCARIAVVDCSAKTQVRRVVERSGWSAEQVERVIAQQSARERRRAIADAVIHNDGVSLEELASQVDRLWSHWCGRASTL